MKNQALVGIQQERRNRPYDRSYQTPVRSGPSPEEFEAIQERARQRTEEWEKETIEYLLSGDSYK